MVLAEVDHSDKKRFICKMKEYIAKNCPLKRNREGKARGDSVGNTQTNQSKTFTGRCNHYGKRGCKRENCWLLEENAS